MVSICFHGNSLCKNANFSSYTDFAGKCIRIQNLYYLVKIKKKGGGKMSVNKNTRFSVGINIEEEERGNLRKEIDPPREG